jgi:hypothetical protein
MDDGDVAVLSPGAILTLSDPVLRLGRNRGIIAFTLVGTVGLPAGLLGMSRGRRRLWGIVGNLNYRKFRN